MGRPRHPRFRIGYTIGLTIAARDVEQARERAAALRGQIGRQLQPLLEQGHRSPGQPTELLVEHVRDPMPVDVGPR